MPSASADQASFLFTPADAFPCAIAGGDGIPPPVAAAAWRNMELTGESTGDRPEPSAATAEVASAVEGVETGASWRDTVDRLPAALLVPAPLVLLVTVVALVAALLTALLLGVSTTISASGSSLPLISVSRGSNPLPKVEGVKCLRSPHVLSMTTMVPPTTPPLKLVLLPLVSTGDDVGDMPRPC